MRLMDLLAFFVYICMRVHVCIQCLLASVLFNQSTQNNKMFTPHIIPTAFCAIEIINFYLDHYLNPQMYTYRGTV